MVSRHWWTLKPYLHTLVISLLVWSMATMTFLLVVGGSPPTAPVMSIAVQDPYQRIMTLADEVSPMDPLTAANLYAVAAAGVAGDQVRLNVLLTRYSRMALEEIDAQKRDRSSP